MERLKELNSLDWKIYTELKNYVGKDNKISATELKEVFNLGDTVEIRNSIARLKKSDIIKRVICADNKGYYLASNEQEAVDYLKSDKQRYLKGLVANYSQVEKLSLNNQARLTFGNYERDFIISLSQDLLTNDRDSKRNDGDRLWNTYQKKIASFGLS